jgi:metallo-beta-lactamase class B
MEQDAGEVESGGKGNFQYGNTSTAHYKPVKVDRVLHDRGQVKLGDFVLTAHLHRGPAKAALPGP